jgi:putative nucleotidyltransferase with HDIG domain
VTGWPAVERRRKSPPALIIKTIGVTFATAALLLSGIFVAITLSVRAQVRDAVRDQLESSQRMVGVVQDHELRDLRRQASASAESPTLKAAVDTYGAEAIGADAEVRAQLLNTIAGELDKLSTVIDADAVVVLDHHGVTLASAGVMASRWPVGQRAPLAAARQADVMVRAGSDLFRVVSAPLTLDDGAELGELELATSLDRGFAQRLSALAHADTLIVSSGALVASTLTADDERAFQTSAATLSQGEGTIVLRGESYAFRELVRLGDTSVYAVASVDAAATPAIRQTNKTLGFVAVGALSVALLGSIWLAHLLGSPIRALSLALSGMAESKAFDTRLPLAGSSVELDQLTGTFNGLMSAVEAAQAETETAYTAAIRALAATLDARDPYTAGHSERVSTLSVAIGKAMTLSESDLEIVRLGALLHDIGKIGVPDEILRKPGGLTAEEFDVIKQHPALGARILRTVPFLAPHLPIVELHHERPDGKGYPFGLQAQDIPLAAHIVHVADAYDAMTSARAYRRERPAGAALRELWAGAGSEFHAEAVAALATALPALTAACEHPAMEKISA